MDAGEAFHDFQSRQEGALERQANGGLPCRSGWVSEWFVISPEYLVGFTSRTSSHVSLCICLTAITAVEEEDKGVFRILYASTLGKSPCDAKKRAVCLRAGADDEKQAWISSISQAQEVRRRDRFFVPLSAAAGQVALQRQRAEAAEAAAAAAATEREAARRAAAAGRLAATLVQLHGSALGVGFASLSRAVAEKREAASRLALALAGPAHRRAAGALAVWRQGQRHCTREVGLSRALLAAAAARERREILAAAFSKLSAPLRRLEATAEAVSEEVQVGGSSWVSAEVQTERRDAALVDAAVQTEEASGQLQGTELSQSFAARSTAPKEEAANRTSHGYAEALLEELGLPSDSGSESGAGSEPAEALDDGDGGAAASPQPTKPQQSNVVEDLEGCLEDAATSVSEVRRRADKLGEHVQEVASRVASRAESLISEVHESIRQEEGQYERRWWQNFAEVVTGKEEASAGERCADTGSSYDLRQPAEPVCRSLGTPPSGSEGDSSMEDLDFEALSTPDSVDLRPAFFHPGGDTGGAGSPQVPALPSALKLPVFKARGPPPRPQCLPPATPSQRLRSSSEPSDSDTMGQGSDRWLGPSLRLRPLPPGPLAVWRDGRRA